jgi:hypothetical protein
MTGHVFNLPIPLGLAEVVKYRVSYLDGKPRWRRWSELCNMNALIRREFVVDVPVERAWGHLARVEAWPSWAKHIKTVTLEPPGELSPSTIGVFRLANGIKARFAVTEFVPRKNWKWIGKFLWLTVHYDHHFEPINHNQTNIEFIIEVKGFGKSVLGKLFLAHPTNACFVSWMPRILSLKNS